MRRVSVGVIGCGYIAQTTHIPNLLKIPEAKLAAVADISQKALNEVREKFGVRECFTDTRELIEHPNVDAVIICTPTCTHSPMTLKAAEAGKHIFCEKPMAMTSSEADRMIKAAEKYSVKLMIGHYLRFLPNHKMAKRLIKRGEIGNVFFAEVHSEMPGPYERPRTHFFFKRDAGGGVLLDYGVHLIDLICWFFEDAKVSEVGAFTHSFIENLEVENEATLIMRLTNDILSQIKVFWLPWQSWEAIDRYVKILGTRGKIVSDLTGPSFTFYKEGSLISRLRGPHRIIPRQLHHKLPGSEYAFEKELEHFVKCVAKDKEPSVTGYHGKTTMKIVEAAFQSSEFGKFVKVDY